MYAKFFCVHVIEMFANSQFGYTTLQNPGCFIVSLISFITLIFLLTYHLESEPTDISTVGTQVILWDES